MRWQGKASCRVGMSVAFRLMLVEEESPEVPVQNVHNASPIIKHNLRNYDLLNDVFKTMFHPSGSYLYS